MKTTKELARELGFLRKRSISNSLHSGDNKNSSQLFSYLMVLDFESTCWNDCKYKTQEIIEFPCVLLNTRTGAIESEFQHYVQPYEHPVLSDFCKQLTGITQGQVEQGIPLSLCLRKFQHWVNRLQEEKSITFTTGDTSNNAALTTIVTWSDWDLGVCLQYECRRKQIRKLPYFNSWIDLRATYRKFYNRKPQGLNGALQDVGIEFEGREHSGLCDARNTARLAWRMIKDGCILSITKMMKPSPSGRSEMVSSSVDIESLISKQKQSVPVANTSNRIPPVIGQTLHRSRMETPEPLAEEKRSLSANKSSNNRTETPEAKMCRTKSPKKVSTCPSELKSVQSSSTSSSVYCGQTSSVKPGLSMRNSNVNTGSDGVNTPVTKQPTKPVSSKTVGSVDKPGLQTLLQKSSKTFNIQSRLSIPTFKTPSPVSTPIVNVSSSTTPHSMLSTSAMKCTPPLCKCGRRSKRRLVQSPGPNVGRFFFSCGQGRGGERNSGCGFFQWETESASKTRQLSRRYCSLGKPYTPILNMNKQPWNSSTLVLTKRQLGIRSSQNTKCLR